MYQWYCPFLLLVSVVRSLGASNPFESPTGSGLFNVAPCGFDETSNFFVAQFQSSYVAPSNAPYSCFSFCFWDICTSTLITNNVGTITVNVYQDFEGCTAAVASYANQIENAVNWPSPIWGQTPNSPYPPGLQNLDGQPCIVEYGSAPCYWQFSYLLANSNPTSINTPDWYQCSVMEPVSGNTVWPSVVGTIPVPSTKNGACEN